MRIILLLSLVLIVAGCVPKINMLSDADSWVIPQVPAKVEPAADPTGGMGALSHETVEKLEQVIVVPPSDKPTKIQVSRKKPTLKQRFKEAMSNTPTHEVKSDNKDVKAYQPKKSFWSLLGRWALLIIAGLFIVASVSMKIMGKAANFSPLGMIKRIFKRG